MLVYLNLPSYIVVFTDSYDKHPVALAPLIFYMLIEYSYISIF
jgi:hypothetical protein